MKLVKSLLLSSAVGLTAVASAQAADLPFRKAAPVEYVRVCDYTGAGYFYIPGTDTCLKISGYAQMNFAYIEPQSYYIAGLSGPGTGTFVRGRVRDTTGFRIEARLEADARTQTAYGTLRTFVRFQADRNDGNYAGSALAGPFGNTNAGVTNVDKAFIQFAGFTAGRVQSFFDAYADNFNFEGIANSDESNEVFAYTATFGGGFSATLSVESPTARRDGILNTTNVTGVTSAVGYAGYNVPDIVGVVRVDQAWGYAQLSGAYHEVRTTDSSTVGVTAIGNKTSDGFAVQAGIQIKLPTIAAGDNFYLQGAYQNGAYLYQDSAGFANAGFSFLAVGGLIHPDGDAVAIANAAGTGYTLALSEGYSVAGAFQHFFTPTFNDVIFGSYEHTSYGRAKNIDWTFGGVGDVSEYRVGNQFNWTPVNNLTIGLEVIYMHIDQTLARDVIGGVALAPTTFAAAGVPASIKKDPSAFEGRLRMERDF